MSSNHLYYANPPIHVEDLSFVPQATSHPSMLAQSFVQSGDWHMYGQGNNYTEGRAIQYSNIEKRRSHQRIPSASTVTSNGPASPYQQTISYPQIAHQEWWPSPVRPESYYPDADQAAIAFPKPLPSPSYTPSQDYLLSPDYQGYQQRGQIINTLAAHFALQQGMMERRQSVDEDAPGFSYSAGQSVSSYGHSPATPHISNVDESDDKAFRVPSNGEIASSAVEDWLDKYLQFDDEPDFKHPVPKFDRTMSDIYQDELFNPAGRVTTAVPSQNTNDRKPSFLAPHNQVITSRLQEANIARSQTPRSIQRERSPFRQGSPLEPTPEHSLRSPCSGFNSAHQAREQQKAESDARAYAQHHTTPDEPEPETMSPKDALLEYHETEEDAKNPLFPDGAAFGGDNYPNMARGSYDAGGDKQAWGGKSTQTPNPRRSGLTSTNTTSGFTFVPPSVPGSSLLPQSYQPVEGTEHEPTPQFVPNLHTMSSIASESGVDAAGGAAKSSPSSDALQKPEGALADTGTFTCTYHGCTRRFESPAKLQKHKREDHRSQAHHGHTSSITTTSSLNASPDTSPAPGTPSTTGTPQPSTVPPHRQSQAGPHKCTRINPSTNKPCNTIFSRPYDLTRHEDTIHNARKQKVRCAYCAEEKTFSRNDALTRHMRVVHPEVEFGAGIGRMRRRQ